MDSGHPGLDAHTGTNHRRVPERRGNPVLAKRQWEDLTHEVRRRPPAPEHVRRRDSVRERVGAQHVVQSAIPDPGWYRPSHGHSSAVNAKRRSA